MHSQWVLAMICRKYIKWLYATSLISYWLEQMNRRFTARWRRLTTILIWNLLQFYFWQTIAFALTFGTQKTVVFDVACIGQKQWEKKKTPSNNNTISIFILYGGICNLQLQSNWTNEKYKTHFAFAFMQWVQYDADDKQRYIKFERFEWINTHTYIHSS